jgi:DNA polymerase-3 subunit delta'
MTLDDIIGNADAVKSLKSMISSGRIPHAMMLYENDGCGALRIALAFLDAIFQHDHKVSAMIHPDVHYIYPVSNGSKVNEKQENLRAELFLPFWRELMVNNPYSLENEVSSAFGVEGKQTVINVAEAREILDKIFLSSFEGGWKAIVLYLPEKMNASCANSLLKVVEEPPEKTIFMMITHAPEKVMPTISSRCQAMRIMPYSKDEIVNILTSEFGKGSVEAAKAADVAGGSVGEALHFLSDREDYQEQMGIFMDLMKALAAHDLLGALSCGDRAAAMSSREKQKAFCKFAGECLRKIFLIQQKLPSLSAYSEEELKLLGAVASKCRKSFPRLALSCFDKAQVLLDRNVNQKIIFCDVVDRLYRIF